MELDELRIIALDERESGKLSQISPDVIEQAGERLRTLYTEAQSIENFLTEHTSELLSEIDSFEGTLEAIVDERFKKILKLSFADIGERVADKEELKKLLPQEREMFEKIRTAIRTCRAELIATGRRSQEAPVPESSGTAQGSEVVAANGAVREAEYTLIRVLDDIDSFMGVDGQVYTLRREDVVTIPQQNADVLFEHNIALNINVG
jgi:DNA replication factor GINS